MTRLGPATVGDDERTRLVALGDPDTAARVAEQDRRAEVAGAAWADVEAATLEEYRARCVAMGEAYDAAIRAVAALGEAGAAVDDVVDTFRRQRTAAGVGRGERTTVLTACGRALAPAGTGDAILAVAGSQLKRFAGRWGQTCSDVASVASVYRLPRAGGE